MKLFGFKVTKTAVWVLVAATLVTGGITTGLVFAQVVPDAVQQGPGGGTQTPPGGDWVDYEESWEQSLGKNETVRVDLMSVEVYVEPSNGSKAEASFKGYVKAYRDGSLPKIVQGRGPGLRLERERTRSVQMTYDDEGSMRGVLTVKLPKNTPLRVEVNLFSGSVGIRDYRAASLNLGTSSGPITVERVTADGDATLKSFSGDMTVTGLTAGDGVVSTSSGKVNAADLVLGSLKWDQFSGDMTVNNLSATGGCDITSSSGKVTVTGFSAESMRIETFSGDVTLKTGAVVGKLLVDGSSGRVFAEGVTADVLDITTFSGNITLPDITVKKLKTNTSSGALTATLDTPADIDCVSFSGGVTLNAPKDFSFTLDTETFSGRIELGYPVTISGDVSKKEVSGKVGDGRYSVKIETSSGDVAVRPRE